MVRIIAFSAKIRPLHLDMKLSSDPNSTANLVRAYGTGYFVVNDVRHDTSIILFPARLQPCQNIHHLSDVDSKVLAEISEFGPEILLIGTGAKHELPSAEVMGRLAGLRCGVEVMSSDAACRTYNVLVAEDRRVAALLMLIHD